MSELAVELEMAPRDVCDDLVHLQRSLRAAGADLDVQAAYCRKCGFRFGEEKLRKPGRCPACRSTWIAEPRIGVRGGA